MTWFFFILDKGTILHIDGLVQDCSISSTLAMEILLPYTKPSVCAWLYCQELLLGSWGLCHRFISYNGDVIDVVMAKWLYVNFKWDTERVHIWNFTDFRGINAAIMNWDEFHFLCKYILVICKYSWKYRWWQSKTINLWKKEFAYLFAEGIFWQREEVSPHTGILAGEFC